METQSNLFIKKIPINNGKIQTLKYAEEFIAYRQVAKSTGINYLGILKNFIKECSDIYDWKKVQHYINELSAIKNGLTLRTEFNTIRKFLSYLETNEEIKTDFHKLFIKKINYQGGNKDIIPDDKMKEMLEIIDRSTIVGLRDYAYLRLLQSTGMRIGEPLKVRVKDIVSMIDDFGVEHKMLIYEQKGGYNTKTKLHPKTYKAIKKYLLNRGVNKQNEPLFIQHKFNEGKKVPVARNTIQRRLKSLFKAVGLDSSKFTSHSIRYTVAYKVFKETGSEEMASNQLKHLSPKTIQYYTNNFRNDVIALQSIDIEL